METFIYCCIGAFALWAYCNHLHDHAAKMTDLKNRIIELEKLSGIK